MNNYEKYLWFPYKAALSVMIVGPLLFSSGVRFRSDSVQGIKFSAGAEGQGYDALITLEVIISQPGCTGSNTLTEWSNQAAHPIIWEHDGLHVTQGFPAYSEKCLFSPSSFTATPAAES